MYDTTCPECKKVIKLESYASQEVTCPSCGYQFTLIVSK
jgi:ribosomal protein S27E